MTLRLNTPSTAVGASTAVGGMPGPSPYGLTVREFRAESRRCTVRGWWLWETRKGFANLGKDKIE